MRKLPSGSAISLSMQGAKRVLSIPPAERSTPVYLVSVFLIFWMGGWTLGFFDALSKVLSGKANVFFYFWLCGWTVGGIFVALYLYRLLRPTEPELYRLAAGSLFYDSGIAPIELNWRQPNRYRLWNRREWNQLLGGRIRTKFKIEDLRTLRLRETEAGSRLTVDQGGERIEIAKSATEVEREWLFETIQKHYALRTLNSSTDTRS